MVSIAALVVKAWNVAPLCRSDSDLSGAKGLPRRKIDTPSLGGPSPKELNQGHHNIELSSRADSRPIHSV
jgi:hypothetical protein